MSYTALYRKLRPKTFDDLVGQAPIVRTLRNQIVEGRIPHAYLFCGTRGTGKTSTAQIFSKAVNCKNPINANPCNECETCQSILHNRCMDVIEIDAASNNSVDDIRTLRDEVRYAPSEAKYKVYIIDEVHMLSTSAFNALLKTLEEPPEHIIFILATTDPQKIPVTIHSRCQRFDFKRITTKDMVVALRGYMDGEGIQITDEALHYAAVISDGAMRDAVSLLDQCTAFYFHEEITLDKVLTLVGSVDKSVFFKLTDYLNHFQTKELMGIIEDIIAYGRDIGQFVSDLTTHFRNLLIAKSTGDASTIFDLSADWIEKLKEQAASMEAGTLMQYISAFSQMQSELKYASNDRILLEVTCIKLCNPSANGGDDVHARLKKLEATVRAGVTIKSETPAPATAPKPVAPAKPKSVPDDIKEVMSKWKSFISGFDAAESAFFQTTTPKYLDNNILTIVCDNPIVMEKLNKKEKETQFITNRLAQLFNKEFTIGFTTKKDYDTRHTMIYGAPDDDYNKLIDENLKKRLDMPILE